MNDAITAAVAWWMDTLAGTPKQDNGDAFQSVFAGWAMGNVPSPTPDQLEAFADYLDARLRDPDVSAYEKNYLGCDYCPGGLLGDAAKHAGINTLRFPIKTSMWIRDGKVTVRYGYSAPVEQVYPATEDSTP